MPEVPMKRQKVLAPVQSIPPPPPLKLYIKPPSTTTTSIVKWVPDTFEKVRNINEGGSGVVSLVRSGDRFMAIKRIRSDKCRDPDVGPTITVSTDRVQDEIKIWQSMNHPHINRLLDYHYEGGIYYLMSEPAEGRDLFDLVSNQPHFAAKHTSFLPALHHDISAALLYLHDQLKVYHGDIKPENIILRYQPDRFRMLSANGHELIVYKHDLPRSENFRIMQAAAVEKSDQAKSDIHYYRITFQLIDLGAARSIDARDVTRFNGTLSYMAPEFLNLPSIPHVTSDIWDDRVDPRGQDIWAFAITMWSCILPNHPTAVIDAEIGPVLPMEYMHTFPDVAMMSSMMPFLWQTERDLGARFVAMCKIEGVTITTPLANLIRGMTAFNVTQRLCIADVATFNLLRSRNDSSSGSDDTSTGESDA